MTTMIRSILFCCSSGSLHLLFLLPWRAKQTWMLRWRGGILKAFSSRYQPAQPSLIRAQVIVDIVRADLARTMRCKDWIPDNLADWDPEQDNEALSNCIAFAMRAGYRLGYQRDQCDFLVCCLDAMQSTCGLLQCASLVAAACPILGSDGHTCCSWLNDMQTINTVYQWLQDRCAPCRPDAAHALPIDPEPKQMVATPQQHSAAQSHEIPNSCNLAENVRSFELLTEE